MDALNRNPWLNTRDLPEREPNSLAVKYARQWAVTIRRLEYDIRLGLTDNRYGLARFFADSMERKSELTAEFSNTLKFGLFHGKQKLDLFFWTFVCIVYSRVMSRLFGPVVAKLLHLPVPLYTSTSILMMTIFLVLGVLLVQKVETISKGSARYILLFTAMVWAIAASILSNGSHQRNFGASGLGYVWMLPLLGFIAETATAEMDDEGGEPKNNTYLSFVGNMAALGGALLLEIYYSGDLILLERELSSLFIVFAFIVYQYAARNSMSVQARILASFALFDLIGRLLLFNHESYYADDYSLVMYDDNGTILVNGTLHRQNHTAATLTIMDNPHNLSNDTIADIAHISTNETEYVDDPVNVILA